MAVTGEAPGSTPCLSPSPGVDLPGAARLGAGAGRVIAFEPTLYRRIDLPAKIAVSSSASSMRISWLYLANRSERASDPVLI